MQWKLDLGFVYKSRIHKIKWDERQGLFDDIRTYLNSDFRRFLMVETDVKIVDIGWRFDSTFNVFIDVVDFALKLLCRTMITRRDDDESTRCKYVAVSIGIDWCFMWSITHWMCSSLLLEVIIYPRKKKRMWERETGKGRENARIPYGLCKWHEI